MKPLASKAKVKRHLCKEKILSFAFLPFSFYCFALASQPLPASAETVIQPAAPSDAPAQIPQAEAWRNVKLLRTLKGHKATIDSLTFTPDGKFLFSGGSDNDGRIKFWWVRSWKEVGSLRAHSRAVMTLAMSPNSEILASCSNDSSLNLWNWKTGKYTRTFLDHTSNILSAAITSDSEMLVTGALDGIRVWNLRTQRPIYNLVRFDNQTYAVATNPNGEILASGGKDTAIKLWDLKSGRFIDSLSGHSGAISTLAFAPDGNTLISGSYDRTIKVWNFNTGQLLYTLSGHTGWIRAIAINPSGEVLATASRDGVRLWNLRTGELIALLVGHSDWVKSVAFSPDGRTLASGGFDRTIKIWQVASP
ncbi:WD40 repeat domain-containing protein [Coleofasciculus sp. H7-2]|uniref:WD40 repeat domain-containing protein n=1 Tax=Coleofasciculus sp. H7-2 TaxID=3351545 RepID=UPI0036726A3D